MTLVVSAATPDRRLTELENVVSSMLSKYGERLTENELKISLLYSKLMRDEDRLDHNRQECSCDVVKNEVSLLEADVSSISNLTKHTSESLKGYDAEIINLKS